MRRVLMVQGQNSQPVVDYIAVITSLAHRRKYYWTQTALTDGESLEDMTWQRDTGINDLWKMLHLEEINHPESVGDVSLPGI